MHVAAKPQSAYPWFIRLFFANQKRKYGQVLIPGMIWGRSPKVFSTLALLFGALDRKSSPLPPPLRSLITVRVSQINHCEFCCDINASVLMKRGVPEEKVLALSGWLDSNLFDDRERAVLAYVEAMTYSDREVDDNLFADLRPHFNDDGIVELTGLIAFQNMSSKFNAALNIAPQGFCAVPANG